MYFKKMESKNIYLSPMNTKDIEIYCKWLNDNKVTDGLDKTRDITTLGNEEEYLETVNKQGSYNFSIVKQEDDALIGSCTIMHINHINQTAELGIMIGEEKERGKGYGKEVLDLLLEYGFNTLNLHNISLGVFSFNENAISCYKKVGFKEIGRIREARYYNGKRYDEIRMDMLKEEFNQKKAD